jgi:hypothetical protein
MTPFTRRALWLDDQLGGGHERLLRRQLAMFAKAGIEVLKASDLDSFAGHLLDRWRPQTGTVDIQLLVLDLMVPQMHGVRDYGALGLTTTDVEVYTCGAQLIEILFGGVDPYPGHRADWNGGVLSALRGLPTCVLSTNEHGQASFSRYRFPIDKPIEFFYKDAHDDRLEQSFGAWLKRGGASRP